MRGGERKRERRERKRGERRNISRLAQNPVGPPLIGKQGKSKEASHWAIGNVLNVCRPSKN